MLYLGNGQRQAASALGPVIDAVPGTSVPRSGSAHLAVGPYGSLYMAEQQSGVTRVTRLDPDGTRVVIAGGGPAGNNTGPCGDGGPATQARLQTIRGLAFGADGI